MRFEYETVSPSEAVAHMAADLAFSIGVPVEVAAEQLINQHISRGIYE